MKIVLAFKTVDLFGGRGEEKWWRLRDNCGKKKFFNRCGVIFQ